MALEGGSGGVFGIGNAVFEPERTSRRGRGIGNGCFEPKMAREGVAGGVFGIGIAVFEPGRPSARAETSVAVNEAQPEQGRTRLKIAHNVCQKVVSVPRI